MTNVWSQVRQLMKRKSFWILGLRPVDKDFSVSCFCLFIYKSLFYLFVTARPSKRFLTMALNFFFLYFQLVTPSLQLKNLIFFWKQWNFNAKQNTFSVKKKIQLWNISFAMLQNLIICHWFSYNLCTCQRLCNVLISQNDCTPILDASFSYQWHNVWQPISNIIFHFSISNMYSICCMKKLLSNYSFYKYVNKVFSLRCYVYVLVFNQPCT